MQYRIQMQDVTKSFGGIRALKGVSFKVAPGEIHALVGENGAGKSTLMKILSGAYQMDSGSILIDDAPVVISSPKRGKELGIGIVYQELELAPDLTVAENIFMDRMTNKAGLVKWNEIRQKSRELIESLGFSISPNAEVRDLTVAYQQIVEIAKAISSGARILIFDEPTAVLTDNEAQKLFETLLKLKQADVSIIYISHRMEEIFQIADTITTLRDGEITGTSARKDTTPEHIIELMIGGKLTAFFPKRKAKIGGDVLRVENLTSGSRFADISFALRAGEVLGIAGLVGSGRTELLKAIFGADRYKSGRIYLDGNAISVYSPTGGVKKGFALVPENRKEEGLILELPIKQNMMMANMKKILAFLGIIKRKKENELSDDLRGKLSVKTENLGNAVSSLSGGNQQKVVLAKWFNTDSRIVLLDEPTRGVDVGAKTEIYKLINEMAADGLGVLFVSSETPELIGMCDRVLVMAKGRISGELVKAQLNEANVLKLAVGGGE
jgi:ABC-type sugar transport system, ATPase component